MRNPNDPVQKEVVSSFVSFVRDTLFIVYLIAGALVLMLSAIGGIIFGFFRFLYKMVYSMKWWRYETLSEITEGYCIKEDIVTREKVITKGMSVVFRANLISYTPYYDIIFDNGKGVEQKNLFDLV